PALALKVDPAAVQAAPAPAVTLEPAPARPMAAVRLRPEVVRETRTLPVGPDLTGAPANPLAGAQGGPAALAMPATPAPVSRPHDFAGLVDRLVAARDAAQTGLPQTVHVSVNNADFGQISLNFSHDRNGLAVSVASADPEFARAVQAAIPAPGAATADTAARDSRQSPGQQSSLAQSFTRAEGSAAGDSGQRQPRGAPAFAADSRGPATNRSSAQDDAAARPRGIFA
ncbi:MAG TPA: hypothetical protein VI199_01310, partial [Novosphingobium sp.]